MKTIEVQFLFANCPSLTSPFQPTNRMNPILISHFTRYITRGHGAFNGLQTNRETLSVEREEQPNNRHE